jgi:hypothetical protein
MRSLKSLLVLGAITLLSTSAANGQEASDSGSLRIGTFDSRAIATAYYNSVEFRAEFQEKVHRLERDLEAARAAGDSAQVERMEAYMPAFKQIMHHQGFGVGSVRGIMQKLEEQLPQIAEDAGVLLIVSKWEVTHHDASVEVVDVTSQIVALFDPRDRVLQLVKDFRGLDPVPFDELLGWSPEGKK